MLPKPQLLHIEEQQGEEKKGDEEPVLQNDEEGEERTYVVDFRTVDTYPTYIIPRITPEEFDSCFYEEHELAEFRYEAHCEANDEAERQNNSMLFL